MKPYPWLKLRKKTEIERPLEPPIWLGSVSNGEYFHEQTPRQRAMRKMILERADEGARRLGVDRRQFLASSAGMATTLAVFNLFGCGSSGSSGGNPVSAGSSGQGGSGSSRGGSGSNEMGGSGAGMEGSGSESASSGSSSSSGSGSNGPNGDAGGYYDTGTDALDAAEQCTVGLDPTKEFIFDIQTHHLSNRTNIGPYSSFISVLPNATCGLTPVQACFERNEYIRQIFLNSDTTVAVLSALAATDDQNPLTNTEIAEARDIINMMAHSQRVVNHCMVLPNYNQAAQFDGMQTIKEMYGVGAWKVYTPWGPNGTGYYLDDTDTGIPMIQRGLNLGINLFCAHKGVPLPGFDTVHTNPRDIGVVAKMFPSASFIVYHSAYQHGGTAAEGPYVMGGTTGVNSLITSVLTNGIGPGQNVYAELGTTWYSIMNDTTQASHVIGKLLKYFGEDNVVWGTDSVWYGPPQPQIDAFTKFQISTSFQQMYGYPALTDAIKRKILGLNAAKLYKVDPTAMRCAIQANQVTQLKRRLDEEFGPNRWALDRPPIRTRRQFLDFVRGNRGMPG
jgi:predicted TIM-barrel fold metal-dependent hydrolase